MNLCELSQREISAVGDLMCPINSLRAHWTKSTELCVHCFLRYWVCCYVAGQSVTTDWSIVTFVCLFVL